MDRLARRLLALAAAYAVALNALLPVVAAILPPTAIGEIGVAVICSGNPVRGVPGPGAPEKPQPLCPCGAACAMPGCAASALPDPDPAYAGPACVPVGRLGRGQDGRPASTTAWPGGSKLARGPPVA
jgi:hypothetical protein